MLYVTLIVLPLLFLLIAYQIINDWRKEKEADTKFKENLKTKYPYPHVPGYRRV